MVKQDAHACSPVSRVPIRSLIGSRTTSLSLHLCCWRVLDGWEDTQWVPGNNPLDTRRVQGLLGKSVALSALGVRQWCRCQGCEQAAREAVGTEAPAVLRELVAHALGDKGDLLLAGVPGIQHRALAVLPEQEETENGGQGQAERHSKAQVQDVVGDGQCVSGSGEWRHIRYPFLVC